MVKAKIINIGTDPKNEKRLIDSEIPCYFGRNQNNQIICDDDIISEKHAVVKYINKNFVIEDLGSHTGTYVNGEKIGKKVNNISMMFNSIEKDNLINLNKGLDTLLNGTIITLGRDFILDKINHKYYFTLNTSLDTFLINDDIQVPSFSLSKIMKISFEKETYLYRYIKNEKTKYLEMKIICKNPLFDFKKINEDYTKLNKFCIGENIQNLDENKKEYLKNGILHSLNKGITPIDTIRI